jgi:hypothetical protein
MHVVKEEVELFLHVYFLDIALCLLHDMRKKSRLSRKMCAQSNIMWNRLLCRSRQSQL